ncbi:unnamed protein product, partial [marine sediment metagenome]
EKNNSGFFCFADNLWDFFISDSQERVAAFLSFSEK